MAALRRRGRCAQCGTERRLVDPSGPAATTCADCAGLPTGLRCRDCGREDKLYERGRCPAAASAGAATTSRLARARQSHSAAAVHEAICASPAPRSVLNWLRNSATAALLADLAAGRLTVRRGTRRPPEHRGHRPPTATARTHRVLPRPRRGPGPDRAMASPAVAGVHPAEHRRIAHAYATWHVLRRLRRRAERARGRAPPPPARKTVRVAVTFLNWVRERSTTLRRLGQADLDRWLTTGPPACRVRDFLAWAADRGHSHR